METQHGNLDVGALVAVRVLDQVGASYRLHQHPPMMRAEDHANSGLPLDRSVKTLALTATADRLALVAMPATAKLSQKGTGHVDVPRGIAAGRQLRAYRARYDSPGAGGACGRRGEVGVRPAVECAPGRRAATGAAPRQPQPGPRRCRRSARARLWARAGADAGYGGRARANTSGAMAILNERISSKSRYRRGFTTMALVDDLDNIHYPLGDH